MTELIHLAAWADGHLGAAHTLCAEANVPHPLLWGPLGQIPCAGDPPDPRAVFPGTSSYLLMWLYGCVRGANEVDLTRETLRRLDSLPRRTRIRVAHLITLNRVLVHVDPKELRGVYLALGAEAFLSAVAAACPPDAVYNSATFGRARSSE